MSRPLLVTHHAPDIDAIGAVWLFKRFDAQHYADAKIAFVDPGDTITLEAAEQFGVQLHEVTHVDTGLGQFDHHQPDRGLQHISATSLVFDHVCRVHPDLREDKALTNIITIITDLDHFGEIHWPEADAPRNSFMAHEMIRGMEFTDPHTDDSQLHFGLVCLDNIYASMKEHVKAEEILATKGTRFAIKAGPALGVETRNDDVIKLAQKQGAMLVVRKDPEEGNIRIKARPDADLDLKPLADEIAKVDTKGTWYYHSSGKMLLNGSRKHRNQRASSLTLEQVIDLVKKVYA